MRTTAMLLHPPATPQSDTGYWHTKGSQILDRNNEPVRITGVNWSGFETKEAVPGGLDAQDYRSILNTIRRNGFNTVRVPFSNEMVESPSVPYHIRFHNSNGPLNSDLRNLSSIEIMDKIIAYAGRIGLKVILDNHRSEAGSSAEENGLWYTAEYPESSWIRDWTSLARRYENNSTVIGMDLRNEPHNSSKGGSCWDCGDANDWHLAAARAGNAILRANPNVLIFVEGVDSYGDDTSWWGGNLEGVRYHPVHLAIPGRLVYSAHEYGPSEYAQSWFSALTNRGTLITLWSRRWAYISETGMAPIWIGEFGTTNETADVQNVVPGSEGQWFVCLVDFLRSRPNVGWTYWGINGEDRYGLLDASYSGAPANQSKLSALLSITRPSTRREIPFTDTPKMQTIAPALRSAPANYPSLPLESGSSFPSRVEGSRRAHRLERSKSHAPMRSVQRNAINVDVECAIAASVQQAVRNAQATLGSEVEEGDR